MAAEEEGEEPKQVEQESDHRAEIAAGSEPDRSTTWPHKVLAKDNLRTTRLGGTRCRPTPGRATQRRQGGDSRWGELPTTSGPDTSGVGLRSRDPDARARDRPTTGMAQEKTSEHCWGLK